MTLQASFRGFSLSFYLLLESRWSSQCRALAGNLLATAMPESLAACAVPTWLFVPVGVLFAGVVVRRALLFGVHVKASDCWKLPCLWVPDKA